MDQLRRKALVSVLFLYGMGLASHVGAENTAEISVKLGTRFGEVLVINNHNAAVLLRSAIAVEQQIGGKWQKMPVTNLALREICLPSVIPDCVELGANTTLHPVPWTGNYCSSQCPGPCRLDGAVPAGTYRFVIDACIGKRSYISASFEKNENWRLETGM